MGNGLGPLAGGRGWKPPFGFDKCCGGKQETAKHKKRKHTTKNIQILSTIVLHIFL